MEEISNSQKNILEQIKEVEVPEELADIHVQAIRLAKQGNVLKKYIKKNPSDPIGSAAGLSQISNYSAQIMVFYDEMSKKMDEYGISFNEELKGKLEEKGVILPIYLGTQSSSNSDDDEDEEEEEDEDE